jgi:hypothetical protein
VSRPFLLLAALAAACGGFDPASPDAPDAPTPPVGESGGAAVPADVPDLGSASHEAGSERATVSGSLDSARGSMRGDRFHLVGALRARVD